MPGTMSRVRVLSRFVDDGSIRRVGVRSGLLLSLRCRLARWVRHIPSQGESRSAPVPPPQGEVASPEAMTEDVPRTARPPPNRHRDKGFLAPGRTPLPFARQASLRYSPLMGENRKHPIHPGPTDQPAGPIAQPNTCEGVGALRLRRVREVAGVADRATVIGAIWGRCGPAGKEVEEEVSIGMPVADGHGDG